MPAYITFPKLAVALAIGAALSMLATSVRAESHTCGEPGERYVCGEIIVSLYDDSDVTIEEVVERNGGNPDADIVNRIESIKAFTIVVGRGNEAESIEQYEEDPAVEYATLNGVEGEVAIPDTAASPPSTLAGALLAWLIALVASAVGLAWRPALHG